MKLKLKTAPSTEPVSLSEVKNYLKIDTSDDDDLISDIIKAARQLCEGYTRRAFITQTWNMIFDAVGSEVRLPRPPIQSVEKISVIDEDGNSSEVSSDIYVVETAENSKGRIRLKPGCSWPSHRGFGSFIVEYKAGYGDSASDVPEGIKQGILQLIAALYENRGVVEEIPEVVKVVLEPYVIYEL